MIWLVIALLALLSIALIQAWARGRRPACVSRRNQSPAGDQELEPQPAVVVPIEDAFDLHTIQPREIPAAVLAYLEAARQAGFEHVRLIHGRGKGFQRQRVRELLRGHPSVAAIHDAPPERGGWGATVVHFKK